MAEAAKWYVVHTYSGYENTVKATIEKTVETRQLQDIIHLVSIPMETVTEITDNGPKTYERKVFPGYVLVKMVMTDEAWYIIKNVRGVTGFVTSGSTKPTPLTEDEVKFIDHELELLAKKNSAEKKPTAQQTANKGIADAIVAHLTANPDRLFTITELIKEVPGCAELTNQRVSAIVRGLIGTQVKRVEEKRKAYFQAID